MSEPAHRSQYRKEGYSPNLSCRRQQVQGCDPELRNTFVEDVQAGKAHVGIKRLSSTGILIDLEHTSKSDFKIA